MQAWVWSLAREDPLEKWMATHSSILAWRIPWTAEPSGLQSMVSQSRAQLRNQHFYFKLKLKAAAKLPSCFSRVRLCATSQTAAHQAPPSLGFSRQKHWSGLPFPSPMHESDKWKWRCSVVSDSQRPHGLQPTKLLCPWDFPGKSTGVQPFNWKWHSFSVSYCHQPL